MFPRPPEALPLLAGRSSLCLQLKARQEQVNGNPLVLDELRTAILLAEEAFPGISDSLVAHMVHRLQRYRRFALFFSFLAADFEETLPRPLPPSFSTSRTSPSSP